MARMQTILTMSANRANWSYRSGTILYESSEEAPCCVALKKFMS
jgi:hypothetical protein